MSGRLNGKVCIVTGASSGFGRAMSLGFAREGAKLVCADLKPTARSNLNSELDINTDEYIRKNGGEAIFVKTDVSKSEDFENLVKETVSKFGRIDVLVNNAGIAVEPNRDALRIHETPEHEWDLTMAVNAKSIFLGCKHVIGQMMKQDDRPFGDRGWIINVASIYGIVGGYNNASYAASKGAVSNVTRTIALEYARDDIHCNAICPGYTETAIYKGTRSYEGNVAQIGPLHPLHGIGKPDDIVGAAVFLASGEARWVTGVNLPVDGGFLAQ
ncbi:3-oxoacyl-[acyl-carrier protein] reductase [Geosmithia morbida]|uniref:3-oxoacyl-[acyl-carrier protein] reductase n=1 Tax=Geosmithia morbida TaxID=1094350 RepID=A0A9P4YQS1_9HYPO|nr:3-oxoacyl-[acyl-carrier protein] reductase [Geosmithia morbida]KAF4120852.1 3-oxoacyl-[acyl-carrier protein] reductase [Geosmithia morbida]